MPKVTKAGFLKKELLTPQNNYLSLHTITTPGGQAQVLYNSITHETVDCPDVPGPPGSHKVFGAIGINKRHSSVSMFNMIYSFLYAAMGFGFMFAPTL